MPTASTSPKPFCFVLMPFSDEFSDVYKIGIKEACAAAGAYCERVDEQIFVESMLERIYNQIAKADFIVADMTGRNANVFYEVGYAHALNKRTILLTQNSSDIPFDLKHFPHIVYGEKLSLLREELTRRVSWHVANPQAKGTDSHIDIDLYAEGKLIGIQDIVHTFDNYHTPYFQVTIHNNSGHTFEPGAFKIGIIVPEPFSSHRNQSSDITTSKLPDGYYLHMFPIFDTLFPNSYDSFDVVLFYDGTVKRGQQFEITFRVFTSVGTRDFKSEIKCS
jgi:hypothetical protein